MSVPLCVGLTGLESLTDRTGRRPYTGPDGGEWPTDWEERPHGERPWEAPPVRDPFNWTPDELAEAARLAREMLGAGSA